MSTGDNMQKDVLLMNLEDQLKQAVMNECGKSIADASDKEQWTTGTEK